MKAMQVITGDGGLGLQAAEVPRPVAGTEEILIRVHAAGVTPSELVWYPTTHTVAGGERTLAIPGHEFSGVVAELGEGVPGFSVGQAVYGMSDWFADGATAEFCLTKPEWIAELPFGMAHEAAATVPIGALTAWQGLFSKADLKAGERVLVHGGSGSVGLFAVQLAKLRGAAVIATASAGNFELLRELGVDQVIDYALERFEDRVGDLDVVFDTVGGETLERSWSALKAGGRMVTVAAAGEAVQEERVKDAFFIVEADAGQLREMGGLLAKGDLKTFVNAAVSFEEAPVAYANAVTGKRGYGKVIILVSDEAMAGRASGM